MPRKKKAIIPLQKGFIDRVDPRDIPLGAVLELPTTIPDSWVNESFANFEVNWQRYGSCVSETLENDIQEQVFKSEKRVQRFSRRFSHALTKQIDGETSQGTTYQSIGKVAREYGCCPEEIYPTKDWEINDFLQWIDVSQIPIQAFEVAKAYKIKGYAFLNQNFDDIKRAIYQEGVCWVAFIGSNKEWTAPPDGWVKPPASETDIWGHSVIAIGYDKDFIYFQNSWSPSWGKELRITPRPDGDGWQPTANKGELSIKGVGKFSIEYTQKYFYRPMITSNYFNSETMDLLKQPLTEEAINLLYKAIFNREPDARGKAYYLGKGLGVFLNDVIISPEKRIYSGLTKLGKLIEDWARSGNYPQIPQAIIDKLGKIDW